jgi:FKBP-type peptidyl-prolyl cis-trans isomerase
MSTTTHDGINELIMYNYLKSINYNGFIICNNIWYFKEMRDNFWYKINDEERYDITDVGHWSGTGIINLNKDIAGPFDRTEIRPERSDAWRLYLGKPQEHNTFRIAETSPVNHPSYSPEQLINKDIYSINSEYAKLGIKPNTAFPELISPSRIEDNMDLLRNKISIDKGNEIMGGYNKRLNQYGLEYNDIWDLQPHIVPRNYLPNTLKNTLGESSLFIKTFGMKEMPKEIAKGSMLTFFIKVDEIKSKAEIEKMREERMAAAEIEAVKRKAEEKVELDKYLAEKKITTKPTESGLIYIEKTKGNGTAAEMGKKVKMNYVGRLLDGTVFDTNSEKIAKENNMHSGGRTYAPFEFTVGKGEVIPGWDEALPMMKVGGKATFIIPSSIAYGEMNQGPIKPFSTLVFEVELLDVK